MPLDWERKRLRDRERLRRLRAEAAAERRATAAEQRAIDAARFGVDPDDGMAWLLARQRERWANALERLRQEAERCPQGPPRCPLEAPRTRDLAPGHWLGPDGLAHVLESPGAGGAQGRVPARADLRVSPIGACLRCPAPRGGPAWCAITDADPDHPQGR